MKLTRRCELDGKIYTMDIPSLTPELLAEGNAAYRRGALVQNAFPFLDAGAREFLLTGTPPDVWCKLLGPADEPEDNSPECDPRDLADNRGGMFGDFN